MSGYGSFIPSVKISQIVIPNDQTSLFASYLKLLKTSGAVHFAGILVFIIIKSLNTIMKN